MPATFRDLLGNWNRLLYIAWRMLGRFCSIRLRTKTGTILRLRRFTRRSRDWAVAYEVFVEEAYAVAEDPQTVRTIVDLGANVGFAALYFAERFAGAHIHAFEPNPVTFRRLVGNIHSNRLAHRVSLYQAAVGARYRMGCLSDDEVASKLVTAADRRSFTVTVLDLFTCFDEPIDVLKMDVEGAEVEILSDGRFGSLRPRHVVLEWHNFAQSGDTKGFVVTRLKALGYETACRADGKDIGVIVARLLPADRPPSG